ncbi:MAG TPA: asparagine synthase-related protein [Polyangia bacterium]|nr:asparagine synthase-related protein [Polyangia bacterium]
MFAFGFVADLDEPVAVKPCVEALLDAWPYGPAPGRAVKSALHAASGVLVWPVSPRDAFAAPIWDAERGCLAAGDVRLYNRAELIRQLDLRAAEELSDLALAYEAYLRWGEGVGRRLRGDFAFVVWNERVQSLFALRDHLGVRPLFYRMEGRRILVATTVAQIVRSARGRLTLDTETIGAHLLRSVRRHARTYFENILSLPPGSLFSWRGGATRTERYWSPPPERAGVSYTDECAEVKDLFVGAVHRRLESDRPIVAHSSGGFDSSAIIMVAHEEYRRDLTRPRFVLASALTPGMPCDDGRYMLAVAERVRFESFTWNALEGDGATQISGMFVDGPEPLRGMGGGPAEDLRVAAAVGAAVLLTGLFGDTVLYSFGISRDLARDGRWIDLLVQAASGRRAQSFVRTLGRASLGRLSPAIALQILNRWSTRSDRRPPAWMGPRLRERYPLPPEQLDTPAGHSHLVTEAWARLTSASVAATLVSTAQRAARAGLEGRLPFLDVDLVERILAVPWDHRYPHGNPRRLGRDALGELLPPEFEARRDQGSWSPVFEQNARKARPEVRRLVEDGDWLSEPFVLRSAVISLLDRAERGASGADRLLLEFGILESWLRYVFREIQCDI